MDGVELPHPAWHEKALEEVPNYCEARPFSVLMQEVAACTPLISLARLWFHLPGAQSQISLPDFFGYSLHLGVVWVTN
jgi:hypothetical protein